MLSKLLFRGTREKFLTRSLFFTFSDGSQKNLRHNAALHTFFPPKKKAAEADSVFFQNFQVTYKLSISEIFSMFKRDTFLRYMNENYRMLPFLFSPKFLREVKENLFKTIFFFFKKVQK